jgi:hypothetical protein
MKLKDVYEYMMWFDDDKKKETSIKLKEGLKYYQSKYNHKPDYIFVREEDLKDLGDSEKFANIEIFSDKGILLSHYLFCIKEKRKKQ